MRSGQAITMTAFQVLVVNQTFKLPEGFNEQTFAFAEAKNHFYTSQFLCPTAWICNEL